MSRFFATKLSDEEREVLARVQSEAPIWTPDSVAPHLKAAVASEFDRVSPYPKAEEPQ